MPEVRKRFKVTDESNDYLWLQLDQDQESGLEVPVPKESPEYDLKISKTLENLRKSSKITATLVSENDDNTAWRIKNIQQVEKPDRSAEVPA